ncbi:hypothetical protein ACET3Z_004103 [Daucus carota]
MQEMEEGTRQSNKALLTRRLSKVYSSLTKDRPESEKDLRDCWNAAPAAPIDGRGNTLLHLLVIRGNEERLKNLMGEVKRYENLKKKNIRGDTALHEAARCGNVKAAALLLEKEKELISNLRCAVEMCNCEKCEMASLAKNNSLVFVRNEMGETALFLAAAFGQMAFFRTILQYNNDDCNNTRNDGCTVLHAAISGEYYRTATKILSKLPKLAGKRNNRGETALNLLAISPSSFESNSFYVFSNMGKTSFIPLQVLRVLFYKCLPSKYAIKMMKSDGDSAADTKTTTHIEDIERFSFFDYILGLPWIQPIDDANQKNKLAVALAQQLLEKETDWSNYTDPKHKYDDESPSRGKKKGEVLNPLIQAIQMGIPELVDKILYYFPDAANSFDEDQKNVFHIAAEHRNGDIYEMLKKSAINKDRMLLDVDDQGNTILHHATKSKIITKFSLGVANLMAWDIFWFQRIRHDCSPHLLHMRNKEGNTAEDLLLKDYKSKREAAESAVKEMNQGLMVVAALIATVSFAAVFTIPGGFDQTKGNPIFYNKPSDPKHSHKNDLSLFLGYVGLTFFASLLALATLLSIQLSRFSMDDLYFSLPLKYSIAISFLFLSSCSTITTFLQALILEDYLSPYYLTCLIIGCVVMGLVYVDSIYDVLSYLVEVLRHSRTYRTQEG